MPKLLILTLPILVLTTIRLSDEARILATVPTASYSHQIVFRPMWRELAEKGHEIVLLTTDPMEESIENIRQINMSIGYEILKKHDYNKIISTSKQMDFSILNKFMEIVFEIQSEELLLPDVQQLIHNKSEKFDLLIFEASFNTHIAFADRFNIPIIAISSFDVPASVHTIMGNDVHPLLHQDMGGLGFTHPLSFIQRTISVLFNAFMQLYGIFYVEPMMNEIIRQAFGENSRPINELMKEVDMLFINVNPVLHPIRAITPNTIMFGGGTHIDTVSKPLPEGIKKFLDSATNGAIYFSLGSNVKSALLRDDLRKVFIESLKELPYKILWKFEEEELLNKPDNVMIQKWVPQGDVLRHPNIKAFITQCGLQSMEEAIMNHIPLVGIPFFADQPANAMIMENKGFGVSLDQTKLTKEQFRKAILEVVNNPKYKQKAIEIADLSTDVEMTGLEKVVWWTEYVIRNKGAKLFRNPIRNIPFYQYYLLDVIAFVGLIFIIVTFGIVKISAFVYRVIRQLIVKKTKKD